MIYPQILHYHDIISQQIWLKSLIWILLGEEDDEDGSRLTDVSKLLHEIQRCDIT